MRRAVAVLSALAAPLPAVACDLALVLALDVSGSVDPEEYAIQRDGLARALADSVVAEALVRSKARVAIVQWTGASRQEVTVPWVAVEDYGAAARLAEAAAADPRVWWQYSTAIGEVLATALDLFEQVPQCRRRVVDISGDGTSNEGREPRALHPALSMAGVTVNAVVIETEDRDLTGYFWENVIHGEGAFVVTASGFEQYAARIREKLIREVADQIGALSPDR